MFTLLNNIDSIKHKLTDQEYKKICDNMKVLYEEKSQNKISLKTARQLVHKEKMKGFFAAWRQQRVLFLDAIYACKLSGKSTYEIDDSFKFKKFLKDLRIQLYFKRFQKLKNLEIEIDPFKVRISW